MQGDLNNFELDYNGGTIKVQRHTISGTTVFRILFADKRSPLVVTRGVHADAFSFWTSIPQGRQKEAQEIGSLIQDHLK